MKKIIIPIFSLVILSFVSGCQTYREKQYKKYLYQEFNVNPVISDASIEKTALKYNVTNLDIEVAKVENSTNRTAARNAFLYDLVRISNYRYGQFKTKIFVHNGVWNTSIDMASLGLSAAATVFGGPAAQAMSATDTAIKGVQTKVTERWLQNQTAIAMITSMDSTRAQVQTVFFNKMTNDYNHFSIQEGIQLIQECDEKASLIDAMAHLQKTISNEASTNAAAADAAKALVKP